MKHHPLAARYQKIVYWSDEDECFVGQCPGLFLGGVHGNEEATVYRELCDVVDEQLRLMDGDGVSPPEPATGAFSGTFNLRIDPGLHRALAARARAAGDSLNRHVERLLAGSVRPVAAERSAGRASTGGRKPRQKARGHAPR